MVLLKVKDGRFHLRYLAGLGLKNGQLLLIFNSHQNPYSQYYLWKTMQSHKMFLWSEQDIFISVRTDRVPGSPTSWLFVLLTCTAARRAETGLFLVRSFLHYFLWRVRPFFWHYPYQLKGDQCPSLTSARACKILPR